MDILVFSKSKQGWSDGCVFDLVPVKRWTRAHKLAAIREAARAMVQETLP